MNRFILLVLFFPSIAARADLVMEQQFGDTNGTGHVVLKLHADKMRMDQQDIKSNTFSVIVDLNTRDSITLLATNKMFLKRSGAEIRRLMETAKKAAATNDLNLPPARAVDSGKAETVDGYDTEIYTWSGAHGVNETLWVATNFPNYAAIRNELARIDQFNRTGPHENAQPELSPLPGMVIKTQSTANGKTGTVTLVSAKAEPVDASLFELPADYVPWKSSVSQTNNTVTTTGKSP
jgi:hypothetical protein